MFYYKANKIEFLNIFSKTMWIFLHREKRYLIEYNYEGVSTIHNSISKKVSKKHIYCSIHIQDNGFLLRRKKHVLDSSSSRYFISHFFVFSFFSERQSHKRITLPTLLKTDNLQPFLRLLANF